MLVMLVLCWLMLALCWLMLDQVGSSWLMLAQVGPSWPQDASMLAQNLRKSPEHTSQGLQQVNFPRFLIQNWSFWNTQNLENIEKSICFIGPFAICTFFVALNACLGLQVGSSSLQVGSCWLAWANWSPSWTKLAPTWLKMRQFCPKLASEKKRFSVRTNPVDAKLAQNLHLKGPGASPRGCTHPLA